MIKKMRVKQLAKDVNIDNNPEAKIRVKINLKVHRKTNNSITARIILHSRTVSTRASPTDQGIKPTHTNEINFLAN